MKYNRNATKTNTQDRKPKEKKNHRKRQDKINLVENEIMFLLNLLDTNTNREPN